MKTVFVFDRTLLLVLVVGLCVPLGPDPVAAAPQNFQTTLVDLDSQAKDTEGIYSAEFASDPNFYATGGLYKLTLEWDHDAQEPIVDRNSKESGPGWYNPKEAGGVCDHDTNWKYLCPEDELPYWLPRFYPRAVPAEVTRTTGIEFASVDWQPCGHKDIVICHGESHYDFHLYYKKQSELEGDDMKCDKSKPIHEQIMCLDDDGPQSACDTSLSGASCGTNHKYFKLMRDHLPVTIDGKSVDYCMDPTSAIPASGVHYGDKSETLKEWVRPVTITGSHDCELTFFEPMVSWKWITNSAGAGSASEQWPNWKSGEIVYNQRTLDAIPTRWQVKVSDACAEGAAGTCHIQIIVYGKKCDPVTGCAGKGAKNCAGATASEGGVKNCLDDKVYYTSSGVLPVSGNSENSAAATTIQTGGSHQQLVDQLNSGGSSATASSTAAPAQPTTDTRPGSTGVAGSCGGGDGATPAPSSSSSNSENEDTPSSARRASHGPGLAEMTVAVLAAVFAGPVVSLTTVTASTR